MLQQLAETLFYFLFGHNKFSYFNKGQVLLFRVHKMYVASDVELQYTCQPSMSALTQEHKHIVLSSWATGLIGYCHTLILFKDDHLQIFGFLPAELSYLTPIAKHFEGFCDVPEGNVRNMQKRGIMVILGTFSSPWAH